jgi:hypothetical protein
MREVGMRRFSSTAAVTVALVALTAGTAVAAPPVLPTPKGGFGRTIPASLLGQHVHYLTDRPAPADERFGAIRIWDNEVRWDQVNTARGVYDWSKLDALVANAQAAGAREIVYVLGSTPLWAAKHKRAGFDYYYGPGTASVPKSMATWRTWVRAVATRYKGRITAYQPWNEANLTAFFWAGRKDSAVQMARLTREAAKVVRRVDPSAKVTTASSTVIQTRKYTRNGWFVRYAKALQRQRVRPDTVAVHLYPWLDRGPGNGTLRQREQGLRLAKQVMRAHGFGKLRVWDTEMNYGNLRPSNPWPKRKYGQSKGAAYLTQTYLFSLANGVSQVYWYGWDDFGLGIWPTSASGRVLQPGRAYQVLMQTLPGARAGGCTPIGSISTCRIKRDGRVQYYVFRDRDGRKRYTVPRSWRVDEACSVLGKCTPIGRKVKVGLSPLLLK